jgi:hypothetical protein
VQLTRHTEQRGNMEQCVEWLNERLLEDCLGKQRAIGYIHRRWLGLSWFQHNVYRINTYHVGGLAEEVLDHN